MSEEKRLVRQTPTTSVVLPYTVSYGTEAVDIYNRSGRSAQPWQELMLEDIMAVNDEGLWVHMKFGWSIPRRNGKSEILIMRSMYAVTHGERTLYTAHRTTTSHNAWEKVIERLAKAGYVEGEDFKTTKKYGLETIEWLKDGEGIINFRTRSSKGGLGEGYDLLIIDDLGTEMTTSFVQSALYQIVNTRLLEHRATIISTNLTPSLLEDRYGAAIFSRLRGEYTFLPFYGEDIRKLKNR